MMRRFLILTVLVFSTLFILKTAPSAHADLMPPTNQISSPPPAPPPTGGFSGSYSTITPAYFPSIPQAEAVFLLGSGTALFGGSPAGGFTISNLNIDATPFTSNLPPSATGPVNLFSPFTLTDSGNGKTATFTFTNPATVNESGMPGGPVSGSLTNSVQLMSNTDTSIDLSAFANGGTFSATFQNIDFENSLSISSLSDLSPFGSSPGSGPGVAIYPSGPNLPISFTFTITPNVVAPEPGSLVLWGLATAAGLSGLRRRLRRLMP
jgi:hypothetical protein